MVGRSCGKVYCQGCSSLKAELPNLGIQQAQRVCIECWWVASVMRVAPQVRFVCPVTVVEGERDKGRLHGRQGCWQEHSHSSVYQRELCRSHGSYDGVLGLGF